MHTNDTSVLRELWDVHPNWLLTLWARNFNTVTPSPKNETESGYRLSVYAKLGPTILELRNDESVYSGSGVDFEVLFGRGFEKCFRDGFLPKIIRASDIADFAQNFTRSSEGTLYVLHQQGGDPDSATMNVEGYFRGGKNACKVYLDGIEDLIDTQTRFAKFVGEFKPSLALGLCYLGDDLHWKEFEKLGELYVNGRLLPLPFLNWIKLLGQDGVQELLSMAEARLKISFPEFSDFSAPQHLI